jgi:hypothetical protein
MRVRLVFVPPGGGETEYTLDVEAPAVPHEGDYVCVRRPVRVGTTSSRTYGAADDLLGKFAWSIRDAKESPLPVGRLRPNALGLFDMLGNAAEWCLGRETPYQRDLNLLALEDSGDEPGPAGIENRVNRGGRLGAAGIHVPFRLPPGAQPVEQQPRHRPAPGQDVPREVRGRRAGVKKEGHGFTRMRRIFTD